MASLPFHFYWHVLCVPFDETELENDRNLVQQPSGDYFKIAVTVKHFLYNSQPQQPPPVSPFDEISFYNSLFLPTQELLQNGASHIQMHFAHPIIPNELLHIMMHNVTTYAGSVLQNHTLSFPYQSSNFRCFKLILEVTLLKESDVHDGYDYVSDLILENSMGDTELILEDSMGEVNSIPASNMAIESLKKVKLEDGAALESCSICLTEFEKDMVVTLTPCKHMYHQECLVKWLNVGHTCPMCRNPLPTSIDD